MSREHVGQREIEVFAKEKVNLPQDRASTYRAQAKRLRDKLESYLGEHPDFALRKMLLSGSLAKGTALRSLNDIDVACYISGAEAPNDIQDLLEYLAERLRKAFPNFSADQVKPQTYCVTVSFIGTGLDVDVVPILYDGDEQWYGNLVSQEDGSYLKTSIPLHLEFCRARKAAQPTHFAQVVRLLKFWAVRMKAEKDGFRFKSFMIELILAKLCDEGQDLSDYPDAMQAFFTYLIKTELSELILFEDYYAASDVGGFSDPVRIIDPVNEENNAGLLYTQANIDLIVDAANEAGDAIDTALYARTKQDTVRHWQRVFGPAFQG